MRQLVAEQLAVVGGRAGTEVDVRAVGERLRAEQRIGTVRQRVAVQLHRAEAHPEAALVHGALAGAERGTHRLGHRPAHEARRAGRWCRPLIADLLGGALGHVVAGALIGLVAPTVR